MSDFDKIGIEDIVPSIYNPRQINNTEYNKLSRSISEFGVINPIIINLKNNHIIGGHQRYDVLYDEYVSDGKYEELYLIRIGDIGWAFPSTDLKVKDLSTEKAMNIALNKISGEWDIPKLENLLIDLDVDEYDLDLTGFDNLDLKEFDIDLKTNIVLPNPQDQLKQTLEKEKQENTNQTSSEEWYTEERLKQKEEKQKNIIQQYSDAYETNIQKGDLFQLGNHRLLCGDAMNTDDVALLMDGVKADTVFTDPPYDLTEYNYKDTVKEYSENANVFILNDDQDAVGYLKESELEFVEFLICDFSFNVPKQNRPYLQHIIMTHETNGDAPQYNSLGDGMRTIIRMKYRGTLDDEIRIHKHQKSIDFVETVLRHFAKLNVLDLFGGSGSTLIGCEELGLNCYMMEIEPKFVQGIIDRWESHTHSKAVKLT